MFENVYLSATGTPVAYQFMKYYEPVFTKTQAVCYNAGYYEYGKNK